MNKKGFTLVELLAVIAILAILVIIALPNVLSMYNQARKDTFVTEVRDYLKSGEQNFLVNSGKSVVYTNLSGVTDAKTLEMTGNKKMQYYLKFDSNGKCTKLLATNGNYKIEAENTAGIAIEQLGDTYAVGEATDSFTLAVDTTEGAKITGTTKTDGTSGGSSTGGSTGGNGGTTGHSGSDAQ